MPLGENHYYKDGWNTVNWQETDVFDLQHTEATGPEVCLVAQSCDLDTFVIPTDSAVQTCGAIGRRHFLKSEIATYDFQTVCIHTTVSTLGQPLFTVSNTMELFSSFCIMVSDTIKLIGNVILKAETFTILLTTKREPRT